MTEAAKLPLTIFAHAYYAEVWREIAARLDALTLPYQLVVTSPHAQAALPFPANALAFEFHRVENRGRDIRPFLIALNDTRLATDICLKIHTKKSPHRSDGDKWRKKLLDDLLGEPAETARIFELMASTPSIGLVSPKDHLVPISQFPGANGDKLSKLLTAYGVERTGSAATSGLFIAGSMFWFRRTALQHLFKGPDIAAFDDELGQTDGTTAHAYERIFALLAEQAGYISLTRSELEHHAAAAPLPFAALASDPRKRRGTSISPFVTGIPPNAGILQNAIVRRLYAMAPVRNLYRKLPRTIRTLIRQLVGAPY